MDLAVAGMSLSVALEIAAYALAAAAGQLAEEGNTVAAITLDRAAMMLNLTIAGPLSVAILCTVIAMWKSRLFPRSLVVVGLLAGLPVLVASLLIGPDFVALMRGAYRLASSFFGSGCYGRASYCGCARRNELPMLIQRSDRQPNLRADALGLLIQQSARRLPEVTNGVG